MALLLAGGRMLDPATGALEAADVLVEGERIAAVAPSPRVDGAEQVDAAGRILVPGLVNAQIEPGRRADLVLLLADAPYLRPLHDPLNALVFAEDRCGRRHGARRRPGRRPRGTRAPRRRGRDPRPRRGGCRGPRR